MKRRSIVIASVVLLAGCATVSQMAATGGSRSDGIVKLSYEVGLLQSVKIDEATSLQTARRRCAVWGYSDAEAFGGEVRQCQSSGMYGCNRWFVTREYQCTAGNGATAAPLYGQAVAPQMSPPAMPVAAGPHKVRANTASGYCLDVPDGYVGTGSANMPAVTSATPRCSTLGTR